MIAILAAALAVAPGPYAQAYCRLRQAGWSEIAALRTATIAALRPGNPDPAGSGLRLDILTAQSAALAQPELPADGEVAQLVALIRQIALAWEPDACLLGNMTAGQLARAADLLERLAQPEPDASQLSDGYHTVAELVAKVIPDWLYRDNR